MKAVVTDGPGDESVLRIADVASPELGSDDLRISVAAAAVNRADLLQRQGLYPAPPGAPLERLRSDESSEGVAMTIERTLSIVKPDAVAKGVTGEILRRFEEAGLRIVAIKALWLTEEDARGFYAVHKDRPFYADLVEFMTSGPIIVSVLEGEGAIAKNRELMGPTDSREAAKGTIRGDFGADIEKNAVHGSDGIGTAKVEIAYFFNATEIMAPVEAL